MAHERDIHVRYLPANSASAHAAATPSAEADDDDLFADALF
jgi:hypothetical protein